MLPEQTLQPLIFDEEVDSLVWQQRSMHYKPRREAWLDWAGTGLLRPVQGRPLVMGERPDLEAVLAQLAAAPTAQRAETLYLTAGTHEGTRPGEARYLALVRDGWAVRYAPKQHSAQLVKDGWRLDVRQTASWYGAEREVRWVARAHQRLAEELRTQFGGYAYVLPTAAQTGRYLLQLTLPSGRRYAVLPAAVRELLQHNNTQGRVEVTTLPSVRGPVDVTALDARWMYAACCANLPSGPAHYDDGFDFLGYMPCLYEVDVKVPGDWAHVGLLPYRPAGAEETTYPATPGMRYRTWAWGPELALAYEHGWQIAIRHRLFWPHTSTKPLDTWATKLRKLRSSLQVAEGRGDYVAGLLVGATRNLLIQTIGSLHRATVYTHGMVSERDYRQVPAGALWRQPGDGHIHWTLESETAYPWTHPEWSSLVWSRCRARLATKALTCPRASVLALRTDAIYLDHTPAVHDDGQPGSWRVKESWRNVEAPRHNADVIALLHAKGMEDDETTEEAD